MRGSARALVLCAMLASTPAVSSRAHAQDARADGPALRAHALARSAPVKMFIPSGTVRVIGWDRDSIVIRGRMARGATLLFAGSDTAGYKIVVEDREGDASPRSQLAIYVPRRSQVALKTADAVTEVQDVGGWFYTVSGRFHLEGSTSSIDVESMSGDIDLDATTPWARAKTGKGHLVVRGAPEDVDASTIGGVLDVATSTIVHGRFTSVTGDIHYAATMAPRSLFEFSNHSGAVDLLLPRDVSARFELSTVEGAFDNGFTQVHPAAASVHNLQLSLGSGAADVTVRTFKGTVRLRSR
jgi:DUF4097 and DUF4098 domain-containing protein YvlB